MSGKRQHFLPRFLQEGFSFESSKAKARQVWVYPKGRSAYATNPINSGVEGQFNTVDGDETADRLVTDREKKLAATVNKLRVPGAPLPPNADLAKLVSHLETTTRNFRRGFEHGAAHMVEKIREHVSDESRLKALLLHHLKKNPLLATTMPDVPPELAAFIAPMLPGMIEATVMQLMPVVHQWLDELSKRLPDATKRGHISALLKSLAGSPRTEQYAALRYAVENVLPEQMILGDSGVFFRVTGERPWKPFLDKDDPLVAVILPISHSQVLVGLCADFAFDLAEARVAAARCSRDFFVAKNPAEWCLALQAEIGCDADPLTAAQLDEITQKLFADLKSS